VVAVVVAALQAQLVRVAVGEGGIPEVRALLHTIGRYRTIGQIERTPEPWCPPEASAGPEGRYRSSPLRKRSAASSSRRARDS
jgi:hypothetical protein